MFIKKDILNLSAFYNYFLKIEWGVNSELKNEKDKIKWKDIRKK